MAFRSKEELQIGLERDGEMRTAMTFFGESLTQFLLGSLNAQVQNEELKRRLSIEGAHVVWDYANLPATFSKGDLQSILLDQQRIAETYKVSGTCYWEATSKTEKQGAEFAWEKSSVFFEVKLVNGLVAKVGAVSDFTAEELAGLISTQVQSYALQGGLGETDPTKDQELYREFISKLVTVHKNDVFVMVKKEVEGKLLLVAGGKISAGDATQTLGELNEHPQDTHLLTLSCLKFAEIPPEVADVPASQVATIGRLFVNKRNLNENGLRRTSGKLPQAVMCLWAFALNALNKETVARGEKPIRYCLFDTEYKSINDFFSEKCRLISLAASKNFDRSQFQIRHNIVDADRVLSGHYRDSLEELYAGVLPTEQFLEGASTQLAELNVVEPPVTHD
jgi:hypothetical protein